MKKTQHTFSLYLIMAGLILSSCELINPSEEVPAYVYIPDMSLETTEGTQGSASAKITEVWVTAQGVFQGAYSLPALVPVLAAGATELMLEAGIKDNGIVARPDIYAFYAPFMMELDLEPEHIDTIRPLIRYRDGIEFEFIENFESGVHLFESLRQGDESNRMIISDEAVFEGRFSGKISLSKEHPFVELATVESYKQLTDKGFQVYLEMNYRSEVPVIFGIIGKDQSDPNTEVAAFDPGFAPKDNWNKIYFNLSALVFDNRFDEYQISLQAFIPEENGNFVSDNATVWLDNIKLVHF